jgi:hypothetical protein
MELHGCSPFLVVQAGSHSFAAAIELAAEHLKSRASIRNGIQLIARGLGLPAQMRDSLTPQQLYMPAAPRSVVLRAAAATLTSALTTCASRRGGLKTRKAQTSSARSARQRGNALPLVMSGIEEA